MNCIACAAFEANLLSGCFRQGCWQCEIRAAALAPTHIREGFFSSIEDPKMREDALAEARAIFRKQRAVVREKTNGG